MEQDRADSRSKFLQLRSNVFFASALPPVGGYMQMENLGLIGNEVCDLIRGGIVGNRI